MRRFINLLIIVGTILLCPRVFGQKTDQPEPDQIPKKEIEALKAKFPEPKIEKWTKEQEGEIVIYDFEFTQGGHKFEVDIKEDGTIHNWEKAITDKDLPEVVRNNVNKKYPSAFLKEMMEVTAVINGKDQLEGYEIVLETTDKEQFEVTIAPDGRVIEEDSGD